MNNHDKSLSEYTPTDNHTTNLQAQPRRKLSSFTSPSHKGSWKVDNTSISSLRLQEGTPGYEALQANAQVNVTKLDKFARKVKAAALTRFVKSAATWVTPTNNDRGKPPRIPPGSGQSEIPETEKSGGNDTCEDTGYALSTYPTDSFVRQKSFSLTQPYKNHTLYSRLTDEYTVKENNDSFNKSRSDSNGIMPCELPLKEDSAMAQSASKEKIGLAYERQSSVLGKIGVKKVFFRDISDSSLERRPGIAGNRRYSFRERRWRKRRKFSARNGRKSYVRGKVIDGQHELYTLSIAVMLGLRTSIGMTNGQLGNGNYQRWLDSDDFMHVEKYAFRPGGGTKTPPHQLSHTFKFKDYSPIVFAYIRRMFGVNEYEFLSSVCGNANFIEFISNAKSGQFFFYSSDGRYMIKTMTNAESKFLRRILPHYFKHCAKNPNTLITKFLGMYRVKMYHLRRNHKFIIMNSVFDTDKYLSSFFDLKGSRIGRASGPGEDVKKDNNVREMLPQVAFVLESKTRDAMREQIKRDCEFFKQMKIMDYSMLIAVHYIPPKIYANYYKHNARTFPVPSNNDMCVDGSSRKNIFQNQSGKESSRNRLNGAITDTNEVESASNQHLPSSKNEQVRERGDLLRAQGKSLKDFFASMPDGEKSPTSDSTLDSYLDNDECSYLDGACCIHGVHKHNDQIKEGSYEGGSAVKRALDGRIESHLERNSSSQRRINGIKIKKDFATEHMYWPFHRYYDMQGKRRIKELSPAPNLCLGSGDVNLSSNRYRSNSNDSTSHWDGIRPVKSMESQRHSCLEEGSKFYHPSSDKMFTSNVPDFLPPLSDRKDGGYLMDINGEWETTGM